MVYDCFPFFNELDLLEIRLNVLKDVVDKFVLVEAGATHTGRTKPFYFEENRERFADFADRIVYVKIDKFPEICQTSWARENWQRNRIDEGLKGRAKDDDLILISDLDEIPNPRAVLKDIPERGVTAFHHAYYSFYLNFLNVREWHWLGTRRLKYRDFKTCFDGVKTYANEIMPAEVNKGTTPSKIRCRRLPSSRGGQVILRNAGWHFTCLGGGKAILEKMRAVAPHHDFDPNDPHLTEERISGMMAKGRGPALKMNCFAIQLDESFPRYILEHQQKYAPLLFKVTPEYLRCVRVARFLRTIQGRFIQFAEWLCPPALHNALHILKMRFIFGTSRVA